MKYTFVSISSQVDKFLQDKESGTVEFKSALGGFPKSFWEHIPLSAIRKEES